MDVEKANTNPKLSWAYWAKLFEGMSEQEVQEYWKKQKKDATSDISMSMDMADNTPYARLDSVNHDYQLYMHAKEEHERKSSESQVMDDMQK